MMIVHFFFYFTCLINFLVLLDEFNIFFDNIFLLLITAITRVIYYICIMLTIMLTNEPEAYDSLARLFDIVCSIKIDWQINIFTFFLIKNFLSILTVQWKERKCLLIAKRTILDNHHDFYSTILFWTCWYQK